MKNKPEKKIIDKYKTVDARMAVENILYICDKVLMCQIRGLGYPWKDVQDVAEDIGDNVEYLANKLQEKK